MAGWGPKFQDQSKSAFDSVNQHMYFFFFIGQVVMGNHTLADTRWVRIAYILDETNVKFTIPSGRDIS